MSPDRLWSGQSIVRQEARLAPIVLSHFGHIQGRRARGKPVRTSDSRDAVSWLFALQHDGKLLLVCEAASVGASVAPRVGDRFVCQAVFDIRLLSSAASTSAYLRESARMKMRPPVDLHFASIEEIAPSPQAVLRQTMCLGVGECTHSTPRHRFDMHRPESLNRLRTHASGQSNAPLAATLASFLKQNFGLYLLGFCCAQRFPPTGERRLGEPMLRAVATLRKTTALPGLNVNRPPLPPGCVLEMFRTHRRFSNAAENPIWNDSALSESRARSGRLHTSHGWQDKAGFPAPGTSFLSICLHIVLGWAPTFRRDERAALFPIILLFQCSESRRPRYAENR
jgi:hypothetical protein